MEFNSCNRALFIRSVCELHLEVFNLTLTAQRIVQYFYINCGVYCYVRNFELLKVLKFANYSEDHLIHDTINVFIFELKLEILNHVLLQ